MNLRALGAIFLLFAALCAMNRDAWLGTLFFSLLALACFMGADS